ncbi:MAG: NAD-binding protein, partial [Hyphomicrobiaceae bacterium]
CPSTTFARLTPLMSTIGRPFHIGPKPGQGQALKLLNNFLSATALAATSEAVAFGMRQGIDMKTIIDVLNVSTGRNTATEDKFPRRIMTGRYDAGFTAKLQAKDVKLYLQNAKAAGVSNEIAGVVAAVWERMASDKPGADLTEMYPYTVEGRRPSESERVR